MAARPVPEMAVHLAGMLAQLNEVPAWVFGLDGGFYDVARVAGVSTATGGWTSWQTVPANISTVTGTHNVYLEFVSGAGGDPPYVSLHYFDFPVS